MSGDPGTPRRVGRGRSRQDRRLRGAVFAFENPAATIH